VAAHGSADRFGYLFEPIDAEPMTELPAAEPVPRARRWWPLPVVAVMVALAGAVAVIQSWPGDVAPGPSGSTTHLVPTPIVTSVPVTEAPAFVAPPEVTAKVVLEPAQVSVPVPSPSPPPLAPPPSSKPEAREAPAPTVRSPNSVSPEPRPAFPNQHVPDNEDGGPGGGLLGRLGL
jgi:hypothetical protein